MNANQKGKRVERELAVFLRAHGFEARRGQQFAGGTDSPDVVCPALSGYHLESKGCRNILFDAWLAQVEEDSAGKPWVIAWKKPHRPWVALVRLETLVGLLKANSPAKPPSKADSQEARSPSR